MQEILLKIRYFERGLSKTLKKLTLFFLSNPVPFNGQGYQKQKWLETSDKSLFMLWNKFRKIPVFYLIPDHVWWCNIKPFFSYSKNYICKFMQANSWHHKLSHFHLSFWIQKLWKGKEKITKILVSQEGKKLFRCNKNIFMIFEALSFGEKIKIWKNSKHKL